MSSLRVATIPGVGRGVIAARDIKEGDIVYSEEPYVLVPNVNRNHTSSCLCCASQFPTPSSHILHISVDNDDQNGPSDDLASSNANLPEASPRCCPFQCGDYYCSKRCEYKYRDHHRSTGECTAFKESKRGKSMLNLDDYNQLRTLAAIGMRCKSEGLEKLLNEEESEESKNTRKDWVELVCSLKVAATIDMDHPPTDFSMIAGQTTNYSLFKEEDLDSFSDVFRVYSVLAGYGNDDEEEEEEDEDEEESEDSEECVESVVPTDCKTDMSTLPVISEFMFIKLCCAFQCNGFSVYNEFDKESASGLYGYSAMINHCCTPNIKKVINNRTLNMVALKNISDGDQVFLSYVGALDEAKSISYNLRQWKLEKQYFFRCECLRCQEGI